MYCFQLAARTSDLHGHSVAARSNSGHITKSGNNKGEAVWLYVLLLSDLTWPMRL